MVSRVGAFLSNYKKKNQKTQTKLGVAVFLHESMLELKKISSLLIVMIPP